MSGEGVTLLTRSADPLHSEVEVDDILSETILPFDYKIGSSKFHPWVAPQLPEHFGLGLIVGSSGSGKSTLLADLGGGLDSPLWDRNKAVASHFDTAQDAYERLSAAGLSSVPAWTLPYQSLSNGQQFRADLARQLHDGARIDEFTSVVDRLVAKSASVSVRRLVRSSGLSNIILATCHRDVIEWLQPDWIIDLDPGEYTTRDETAVTRHWWAEHVIAETGGIGFKDLPSQG